MSSCDGSLLPVMSVSWDRPRPAALPADDAGSGIEVVLPDEMEGGPFEPAWSLHCRVGLDDGSQAGNGRRTRVCAFTIRLQVILLSCCDHDGSSMLAASYRIAAASRPYLAVPVWRRSVGPGAM